MTMETVSSSRLTARRVSPARFLPDIVADASAGLMQYPRSMPPKYFYDERGSRLFDAICETREYYPTRTEEALLQRYARDIVESVSPDHILEFGSGTARKTRHLLDACSDCGGPAAYWPFDVCEEMLLESGEQLVQEYDWLDVNVLVGDYLGGLADLPGLEGSCLYLFLGGTIGNFTEQQARNFLDEVRSVMDPGDHLLLGADRVKEPDILHMAYNDEEGITAEFNLNLLQVLNRELDADFRPEQFRHRAHFNCESRQIEMYLVSKQHQSVRVGALDATLELQEDEQILTEISRKFTPSCMEDLFAGAGLEVERHFEAENGYFSLFLSRPV